MEIYGRYTGEQTQGKNGRCAEGKGLDMVGCAFEGFDM